MPHTIWGPCEAKLEGGLVVFLERVGQRIVFIYKKILHARLWDIKWNSLFMSKSDAYGKTETVYILTSVEIGQLI